MATAEEFLRLAKYPLNTSCDMPSELKDKVLDTCLAAAEKFPKDFEKCTQTIKESLDRHTGGPWHVVAGMNFAYDVTHKRKGLQQLYIGGTMGILVWKT